MWNGRDWDPYVTKAEREAQTRAYLAEREKDGLPPSPVAVKGRAIATSFWGKSWCRHLESYADFESRLTRGRSYVRNGSVVDLQIDEGVVGASVMGSELYLATIRVSPLAPERWKALVSEHASGVSSVVELLQGKLPSSLLKSLANRQSGLFPPLEALKFHCTCPDAALICKHIAAALYGVGARLDDQPELFFVLRGVDVDELSSQATADRLVDDGAEEFSDDELSALFGIELS